MAHGIAGFDHAIVGVSDLEAARETWRRLGFVVTPRGRHIGWGTANYCVMFGANYVELLGVVDATQFVAGLDQRLRDRGEGLLRLAFGAADSAASVQSLRAAGLKARAQDLARELELPGGTVLPRFSLVHLAEGILPILPLFLTQHLTPEMIRRDAWLVHPNGTVDLAAITLVAPDPPALLPLCEKLFGDGSCNLTDSTLTVISGGNALVVMPADEAESIHPDLDHDAAGAATLTFRTADLARTALVLEANGVPFVRALDQTLTVAPAYANGVVAEFTDRPL